MRFPILVFKDWWRTWYAKHRFPTSRLHTGVILDRTTHLDRYSVLFSDVRLTHCEIGAYTYIQERTVCFNTSVGPFCSIASDVTIGLVDHPTHFISTSPVFYDNGQPLPRFFVHRPLASAKMPRTTIGADVWIGQGVLIKAGLNIGVGSVIGAGAVVTRDVDPYTIVTGVPAKPLRRRFNDDLGRRLMTSRWWMRNDEQLIQLSNHFNDPEVFLRELERLP